jgi:hypothetical protein
MVIFMLGQCSLCGSRYAIAPDVTAEDQWLMFERKPTIDRPSHLSLGGMLCVHGHALELTAEEAVLTTSGQWLVLRVAHPEPALN